MCALICEWHQALAVLSPRKRKASAESNVTQTASERARALSERAELGVGEKVPSSLRAASERRWETSTQAGKTPTKTPTHNFPHGYIGETYM